MASGPLLIAIGDLHGHSRALARLLQRLHRTHGVLEGDGLHAGVELVVTGDLVDRGDDGLGIIARLRRLARGGRGRVVGLLGNHEIMALEGVEGARALLAGRARDPVAQYELTTLHGHNGGGAFVREFGPTPRAALAAFARRMGPRGDVGRFLRALRTAYVARVGARRVLLVHGDLAHLLRPRENLARYLAADAICAAAEVDYIVTGHTPHDRIACYGGRIFGIDVGMTPYYGENEPIALVFDGETVAAVGADRGLVALPRTEVPAGAAA